MNSDRDFEMRRNGQTWRADEVSGNMIRVALLFGSVAVALALLIVPILNQRRDVYVDSAAGLDVMSTSSIRTGTAYTVRRSVLQPSPNSICVIRANGTRSGDC